MSRVGKKPVELGKDVPQDATWFAKLEQISALWLEGKGKKEMDFMVGEIGRPVVVGQRVTRHGR